MCSDVPPPAGGPGPASEDDEEFQQLIACRLRYERAQARWLAVRSACPLLGAATGGISYANGLGALAACGVAAAVVAASVLAARADLKRARQAYWRAVDDQAFGGGKT